jgi:hypothetical protein
LETADAAQRDPLTALFEDWMTAHTLLTGGRPKRNDLRTALKVSAWSTKGWTARAVYQVDQASYALRYIVQGDDHVSCRIALLEAIGLHPTPLSAVVASLSPVAPKAAFDYEASRPVPVEDPGLSLLRAVLASVAWVLHYPLP